MRVDGGVGLDLNTGSTGRRFGRDGVFGGNDS